MTRPTRAEAYALIDAYDDASDALGVDRESQRVFGAAYLALADAIVGPSVDAPTPTLRGGRLGDDDGDAAVDADPDRLAAPVVDLDPFTASALNAIIDARAEGNEVLVITEPDLVSAVVQLLDHQGSPISVASTTEDRGAAESSFSSSAAPRCRGCEG